MIALTAFIAHDARKELMLEFVRRHLNFFRTRTPVATGNMGRMISVNRGLSVECWAHGPHGGDLIIGGRVAEGRVEAVLFRRDPLTAQPHEPDVAALMRVCDVYNVALANNPATAEGSDHCLITRCSTDSVRTTRTTARRTFAAGTLVYFTTTLNRIRL